MQYMWFDGIPTGLSWAIEFWIAAGMFELSLGRAA
jgi:hypothetical protein